MSRVRGNSLGYTNFLNNFSHLYEVKYSTQLTLQTGLYYFSSLSVKYSPNLKMFQVDHSPPPRVEVKNEWGSISPPPIRAHGVDRDNFTFETVIVTHFCIMSSYFCRKLTSDFSSI
jgi:hypothetical protein